jgi:hypothetical protein
MAIDRCGRIKQKGPVRGAECDRDEDGDQTQEQRSRVYKRKLVDRGTAQSSPQQRIGTKVRLASNRDNDLNHFRR